MNDLFFTCVKKAIWLQYKPLLNNAILWNCISYMFWPFFTEYFSLPKSQNCTVFPLTAFYFFQHHLVLTLLLLLLPVFSVLVFCSVNQSRHFLLSQLRWKIVYHVQFSPDFVVDSGSWLLVGFSFQSIATLMVVVHLSLHFAQLDIAHTN